ncbi:BA14K family protein [Cohaesibacter celericrescens]|uniref:Lectin-like protein BA14k n=1 Tax=Cohaesibacter celericrescens TaxID=2067669 RepID=A0A2N5XW11_9HYPH|nr:BA14K family protein [Cohaesibacter celericrescens]PLW78680.1 hypothetical protein C0081_00020 [Cohaesibacter celericrescens]
MKKFAFLLVLAFVSGLFAFVLPQEVSAHPQHHAIKFRAVMFGTPEMGRIFVQSKYVHGGKAFVYPSKITVGKKRSFSKKVVYKPVRAWQRRAVAHRAWTPEWFAYCARKYKSFNAHTGKYRTYSGRSRMCR